MSILSKLLNFLCHKETPMADLSPNIAAAIATMKAAEDKITALSISEAQATKNASDLAAAQAEIAALQASEADMSAQLAAATAQLDSFVNPPAPAAEPAVAPAA